jgi:two-component system, response regulator PdtaR
MSGELKAPIRIALAEDEPVFLQMLTLLLKRLGHEVICAVGNGADLIDRCAGDDIDLAIVDLDMPIMDGLATAEHLTKCGVPVILISGHPDAQHVVLEHEPIAARLTKPFTIEELQQAIDGVLQRLD